MVPGTDDLCESSPEKPSGTTNIFYTKAQPGNFMLKTTGMSG
jgi:hypothetical protein